MLSKVAESQALRKAFNFHGVYSPEEMEAEITRDPQTELGYLKDTIQISEKIHSSKENYDEWSQDIKTKILDDITACETSGQLSHVKKEYEADIGRLMDEDRAFILEEFDHAFQNLVSGETELEFQADGTVKNRKTGQEVELGEKPPVIAPNSEKQAEKDLVADLKERETFGQEFLKQAVAELKLCSTRAQLNLFKNKKAQDRMRLLEEHRLYFDALLKQAFEKAK
jgi:hypothetical protein